MQWLAAKLRPPHLTAIAPQSPGAMFFYETPYLGGVLYKSHLLTWPELVAKHAWEDMQADFFQDDRDPDAPLGRALRGSPNEEVVSAWHQGSAIGEAMLDALRHPTLDDWWEQIMLTAETAAEIDIPILQITGFHDGDQAGALYNWELVEANNASGCHRRHLLVGPWRHAQMATGQTAPMGEVTFADNADLPLMDIIRDFLRRLPEGR